jgi:uncharacterized protein (TIGR03437 family)
VIFKNTLSVRLFAPLLFVSGLSAAPRLNLVQTALTVSVPSGTNGAKYSLDTFNIGSGTLNLQASSSVPWLVPTVGTSQVCGLRGGCYPVSIAFQTSALAAGAYTGIVTLSDPNAVDSPQTITVTAQVGGDVPPNLTFYLAPGGTTSTTFTTNGPIASKVSNAPWLTTSTSANAANGSYVTTVTAAAGSSMAATDYNGTITIGGSSFAPDNKQISVALNVTTQPIAQASSSSLSFEIPQGGQAQTDPVGVTNAGQGKLTVSSVGQLVPSNGTEAAWLTEATVNGGITVTANPVGLSAGAYSGTVSVASNGINGNLNIPVELTIVAQGAPVAAAGGVVNNGTFGSGEPLAQGDIAAVFGNQFTFDASQSAASLPLQTTLDNVQVLVNGKAAPVYYVSSGQINFEIPIDAATGDGTVQVVRNGQAGNLIYVDINAQVPRFIVYGGTYAIMTTPAGALTGVPSNPVKIGDTIVIYALGLGPTSPPVPSGTASPSSTLAVVPGTTKVCFGIETPFFQAPCATPLFVGLTPNFVGLYQVNVTIPSGIASGNNTMALFLVDNISSDSVQLAVQ